MSNDLEKRILEEDAERIEADRKKWIIQRKQQRSHLKRLKYRMCFLNQNPDVDTAEEMWKNEIEPNLDKE